MFICDVIAKMKPNLYKIPSWPNRIVNLYLFHFFFVKNLGNNIHVGTKPCISYCFIGSLATLPSTVFFSLTYWVFDICLFVSEVTKKI